MDDRRLTFIVVPHGNLETRTYEISYRWLKVLLVFGFLLVGGFAVMVGFWWYIASQAARVPGLVQEVQMLQEERAKVAELARTLAEVEAQYERVRQLLGADAAPAGREPLLPPLRTESRGNVSAPRRRDSDAWRSPARLSRGSRRASVAPRARHRRRTGLIHPRRGWHRA